jgi:hypothetical protein
LLHAERSDLIFLNNRHTHTNQLHKNKAPETKSQTHISFQPKITGKSQKDLSRIIQKALNRKQISHAYHTSMPAFMKSDGPFNFYDHALRYANSNSETPSETVTDKAALQALHRYEKDLLKLKERREAEKT